MVIMSTSATDVSIHAVSPEFGVHFSRTLPPQAGGTASCANAISVNARQRRTVPNGAATSGTSLRSADVPDPMSPSSSPTDVIEGLRGGFDTLSIANAGGSLDRKNKDLAV